MTNLGTSAPRTPLVIFSPLPPQRNGIADYSAGLLPGLQAAHDCTVVVEDGGWAIAPAGICLIQASEYTRSLNRFSNVLHLYHLGNSQDHVYMLEPIARTPGLIVLHDAGLHHLLDSATLEREDRAGYAAALAAEYGWAGSVLASQLHRWGLRGHRMHADLPMIRGIAGAARGIVVHSETAADRVRLYAPEADVSVINHYAVTPASGAKSAGEAIRRRLGVAAGKLLIVSLGFITRAKQIDLVLRALADMAPALPPFLYLIAGEARPGELDVARLANELGLAGKVVLTGYLAPEDIDAVLSAADLLVNLRYPTLGETSGTLMRALAHGVCTIVTDVGAFRDVPEDVVVRLAWDGFIRTRLGEALRRLVLDGAARRRVGEAATRWADKECSLGNAVQGYLAAIAAAAARKPMRWTAAPSAWKTRPRSGPRLIKDAMPLWLTAGLGTVPVGPCRVLAVLAGEAEGALLEQWLGSPLDCDLRQPPRPDRWAALAAEIERRTIDLALVSVTANLLPADPLPLLRGLNAVMGFGGVLLLDIDGGTGTRDESGSLIREESGRTAIELAGFQVEMSAVAPPPLLAPTETEPRASYRRCWRAVKVSEFTTAAPRIETGTTP